MTAPIPFPRMFAVRQKFPPSPPLDIPATVQREFKSLNALSRIKSGAQIAVAVGSRGITNIKSIVRAVLDILKAAGAKPFILPAMGSHGGATPGGQLGVLERDRKSTRLNSSHGYISYAVFCLKKKKTTKKPNITSHNDPLNVH